MIQIHITTDILDGWKSLNVQGRCIAAGYEMTDAMVFDALRQCNHIDVVRTYVDKRRNGSSDKKNDK